MIILQQQYTDGTEGSIGIPLNNFMNCNETANGEVWVIYWQGEKVMKAKVNHTLQDIQHKVFVARHGKQPAKGLIV